MGPRHAVTVRHEGPTGVLLPQNFEHVGLVNGLEGAPVKERRFGYGVVSNSVTGDRGNFYAAPCTRPSFRLPLCEVKVINLGTAALLLSGLSLRGCAVCHPGSRWPEPCVRDRVLSVRHSVRHQKWMVCK